MTKTKTNFFLLLTRQVQAHLSVAIAVLSLIVASSAGATPILGAGGLGSLGEGTPSTDGSGSTGAPVSGGVDLADSASNGSASGTAVIGKLGAEARAARDSGVLPTLFIGSAHYSDTVVISGPGSDPVPVRMNLHFGGSLNSTNNASASATASAFIYDSPLGGVDGKVVGITQVIVFNGVPDCTERFGPAFTGLSPCGFTYDDTLTSILFLVPQDTPIKFELQLISDALARAPGTSATSLFSSTFGFIVGGPVFDLPEGFSADSPTSFIVGNRFLPEGPPAAAVPEPSSMLLVISALGLLGMLRRRHD